MRGYNLCQRFLVAPVDRDRKREREKKREREEKTERERERREEIPSWQTVNTEMSQLGWLRKGYDYVMMCRRRTEAGNEL